VAKERQTRAIYHHLILRLGAGERQRNLRPGLRERELRFLMLLAETFAPGLRAHLSKRDAFGVMRIRTSLMFSDEFLPTASLFGRRTRACWRNLRKKKQKKKVSKA
jgi:hypothetical protein